MDLSGANVVSASDWLLEPGTHGSPQGPVVLSADNGQVLTCKRLDGRDGFDVVPAPSAGVSLDAALRIQNADWVEVPHGGPPTYRILLASDDGSGALQTQTEIAFTTITSGSYVAHVAARRITLPVLVMDLDSADWVQDAYMPDGVVAEVPTLVGLCTATHPDYADGTPSLAVLIDEPSGLLLRHEEAWTYWMNVSGRTLPTVDTVYGLNLFELRRESRSGASMLTVSEGQGELTLVRVEEQDTGMALTLFAPYAWCP